MKYPIPKPQIRAVVEGVMLIDEAIDKLERLNSYPLHHEVEGIRQDAISFREQAAILLRNFAIEDHAGHWALATVPPHLAAGMVAGLYNPDEIDSVSKLILMCGMEPRRYPSNTEVKEAMRSVRAGKDKPLSDKQIIDICRRIDRDPGPLIGSSPAWDDVFLWATKRHHSEFLRSVCLRIGTVLSKSNGKYRDTYERVMEEEGKKNLEPGYNLVLAQIHVRAAGAATREWLRDYFVKMKQTGEAVA